MPPTVNQPTPPTPDPTTSASEFPSSTPTPSPTQIGSTQPVITPVSGSELEKHDHKKKLSLVVAVSTLVVLSLGSVGAYYGVIVPNKPQSVLKKAIKNTLLQHQISSKGKLSIEDSAAQSQLLKAFDIKFETQTDLDKNASALIIKPTISGVEVPVEFRTVDHSLFFKFGDLSTIKSIVQTSAPTYVPIVDKVNLSVANKWVEVDATLLRQAKYECVLDLTAPLTKEDVNLILKSYKNNQFSTTKTITNEKIHDRDALRFDLVLDNQKAVDYSKNLGEVSTIKRLNDCFKNKYPTNSPTAAKTNDQTPMSVWVDKKTKLITRVELSSSPRDIAKGTKGNLSLDLSYDKVSIDKPEGARPLVQVLAELSDVFRSIFGGNGASGAAPPPAH